MNTLDNQFIGILPKSFTWRIANKELERMDWLIPGFKNFVNHDKPYIESPEVLSGLSFGQSRAIKVFEEPTSLWQLGDGTTFECTHEFYHNESVECDTMVDGEHSSYDLLVIICDDCGRDLVVEPDYE